MCEPSVCARGAPPPTPMCPFSSGISLASILLATSDRTCVSAVGGVARGTAWRGAERVRGSLVAPVRRERPWARFHKRNHPPKRSHCHRPPEHGPRASRSRANTTTPRNPHQTAARGAPAPGPTTRRREHPRRSSAGVPYDLRLTLQLGLVHRRVYRTQPTGAHENVRVPVPADRPRTYALDVAANPTQAVRHVPRRKDTRRAVAGSRVGPSGSQLLRTDP